MLKFIMFCLALSSVLAMPMEKKVVVIPPKFLERVQNLIRKCEAETMPPPDTFTNMLKGYVENEASLNFMYCYLLDVELIVKDGHFNVNKLLSFIKDDSSREDARRVFEDCNNKSGEDTQATLRLMINCYRENSPVIYTL